MKKIILSGFLCLTFTASAQKEYFSIIGKTFVEEHIVPDHTTTSPLGGGTYIRVKEIPKRGWLADAEVTKIVNNQSVKTNRETE